jgi:hypothetical protein
MSKKILFSILLLVISGDVYAGKGPKGQGMRAKRQHSRSSLDRSPSVPEGDASPDELLEAHVVSEQQPEVVALTVLQQAKRKSRERRGQGGAHASSKALKDKATAAANAVAKQEKRARKQSEGK